MKTTLRIWIILTFIFSLSISGSLGWLFHDTRYYYSEPRMPENEISKEMYNSFQKDDYEIYTLKRNVYNYEIMLYSLVILLVISCITMLLYLYISTRTRQANQYKRFLGEQYATPNLYGAVKKIKLTAISLNKSQLLREEEYNKRGLIIKEISYSVPYKQHYYYDSKGKVVETTLEMREGSTPSKTLFIYNSSNLISSIIEYKPDGSIFQEDIREYNDERFLIKEKSFSKAGTLQQTINYTYNHLNNSETMFTYDANNKLIKRIERIYNDSKFLIEEKSFRNAEMEERIIRFYDKYGNTINESVYDKFGKLIRFIKIEYEYDALHNWIRKMEVQQSSRIETKRIIEYYWQSSLKYLLLTKA